MSDDVSRETSAVTGNRFRVACKGLGVCLTDEQSDLFYRYDGLLRDWAQRVRLVSRGDADRLVERHFLDCLAVLSYLPEGRLLDLGSGGGLPGIPVKIATPDREVVLVEAARMKALFLREAVSQLSLEGIRVHHGRAEALAEERGLSAAVTARAVTDLRKLWKWSRPLLAPGGQLIAFKGPMETDEWKGAERWKGVGRLEVNIVEIPGGRGPRAFVKLTAGAAGGASGE